MHIRIRKWVKIVLLLIILISAFFLYSRYLGTKGFVVKEYSIIDSKIPDSFYGLKIVQISDIHYKVTTDKNDLIRIVKDINLLKPDIVILSGDLFDSNIEYSSKDYEDLKSILKSINYNIDKYAIKGEQDLNIDKWEEVIQDGDFRNLNDTYDTIYYESNNPILLVGISSNYENNHIKNTLDDIYSKVNKEFDYNILVLHEPDFIGDININSLALIPLMDEIRMFGLMIVGSDKEDFFDKGLNYYESCIVEFGVAIKSSNLYLKTQDMARKDGLTGIYNRLYFKELFADAASLAVKNNMPISVALFDIDKFKNVNDTYGHLMGDEVIKMVAHVSETYAEKNGGFACRYGGEEFLIVLPGFDEKQALPILEDMHETIKTTGVRYNDMEIFINVCIGYSTYPSLCDDVYLLVSRADRAMYYGKRNGRGRLIMDSPSLNIEE